MEWYPHEIDSYDADTLTLTLAEDGAYCRLLRWYYRHERPIPADARAQAAICRVGLEEWQPMQAKIMAYFVTRDSATIADTLHHDKCDRVIIKQTKRRRDQRDRQKKHRKRGIVEQQKPRKSRTSAASDSNAAVTRDSAVSHGARGEERRGNIDISKDISSSSQPMMLFDDFWAFYPRKVGKFAAKKIFEAQRKKGEHPPAERMREAITRYIETKKPEIDYCHPRTWLSQGRWTDEVKPAAPVEAELELPKDAEPWRVYLLAAIGPAKYKIWFEQVRIEQTSDLAGEQAEVISPSRFCKDYIGTHYATHLSQILKLKSSRIKFTVAQEKKG